jgi:hypothetical protein
MEDRRVRRSRIENRHARIEQRLHVRGHVVREHDLD